jgi:hypothetical protein
MHMFFSSSCSAEVGNGHACGSVLFFANKANREDPLYAPKPLYIAASQF